jgi:hypothetical protein
MASKKGARISSSPKKFNTQITGMNARLQALAPGSPPPPGTPVYYYTYYGLSSANGSDFNNKYLFWSTPVTGLYAQYNNPVTSSSTVKNQVKIWIKAFRAFAAPLLNIIAASANATSDDEAIFNLVLNVNRKKPTHSHTPIADQCFTDWTVSAGGNMKAGSKSAHDSKRHSLAEGADGVQYATMILDDTPENITNNIATAVAANLAATNARIATPTLPVPVPLPIPAAPPAHPDDRTAQVFYSGATHPFSLGASNKGNYLYVWSRWYNSKHPELAGDWNSRQVILIN